MTLHRILAICLILFTLPSLSAQQQLPPSGDATVADRYAEWILHAVEAQNWEAAEEAVKRAEDFIYDSSDISYLTALVSYYTDKPKPLVLNALKNALELDKWYRYNPDAARLLEAEILIRVQSYNGALESLARISPSALDMREIGRPALPPGGVGADTAIGSDISYLRLKAYLGLGELGAFRTALWETLERYSWDTRPVSLLFRYAAGKIPEEEDLALIALALRRLPLLLEGDPDLAFLACPFIRDIEEARRLIESYRAMGHSNPASLIPALNLGVIDEEMAINELFASNDPAGEGPVLDRSLLFGVFGLLRHTAGRDSFSRNLSRFSGVIIDDLDVNGIPKVRTRYRDGMIQEYTYDATLDGYVDLRILFQGGSPIWGEVAIPSESADSYALVYWEQYPWVVRAVLEDSSFAFRPRELSVTPLRFSELGSGFPLTLQIPMQNAMAPRLTKRTLIAYAAAAERPSREFPGAVERIELARGGLPLRSAEYLNSRTISVTDYLFGRPRTQRVDLDLDGIMETVRYFRREAPPPVISALDVDGEGIPLSMLLYDWQPVLEAAESDWDGDGIYETGIEYHPDGSISRSWDLNRDGIKEYTVRYASE